MKGRKTMEYREMKKEERRIRKNGGMRDSMEESQNGKREGRRGERRKEKKIN